MKPRKHLRLKRIPQFNDMIFCCFIIRLFKNQHILSAPVYGVFILQCSCYANACSNYTDFFYRAACFFFFFAAIESVYICCCVDGQHMLCLFICNFFYVAICPFRVHPRLNHKKHLTTYSKDADYFK